MSRSSVIAAALLLGCSSVAWATDVNTGQVFVSPSFSGGTGPFSQTTDNAGPIDISGSATGGFTSAGSASLHLQPGVIKLSGEFSGSGDAIARGILRDDLTFSAPGVAAGTMANVTFWVYVNGALSANNVGVTDAGWQLQADLGGGAFDINRAGTLYGSGPYSPNPGYHGDSFGWYSATVAIQIGYAAPLDIELTGSAQGAYEYDTGLPAATFDLGHSLYWGGISSVTVGGVNLASYSVASASGLDYSASLVPVPEPSTAWLGVFGFGALLLSKGGRRVFSLKSTKPTLH